MATKTKSTQLDSTAAIHAALDQYRKLPKPAEGGRGDIGEAFFLPQNAAAKWRIPGSKLIRAIAAATIPDCREKVMMWPTIFGRNNAICSMRGDAREIIVWMRCGQDFELGDAWDAHLEPVKFEAAPGWERQLVFSFSPKAGITLEMLVELFEEAARVDANEPARLTIDTKLKAVARVLAGEKSLAVAKQLGVAEADVKMWHQVASRAAMDALART